MGRGGDTGAAVGLKPFIEIKSIIKVYGCTGYCISKSANKTFGYFEF